MLLFHRPREILLRALVLHGALRASMTGPRSYAEEGVSLLTVPTMFSSAMRHLIRRTMPGLASVVERRTGSPIIRMPEVAVTSSARPWPGTQFSTQWGQAMPLTAIQPIRRLHLASIRRPAVFAQVLHAHPIRQLKSMEVRLIIVMPTFTSIPWRSSGAYLGASS